MNRRIDSGPADASAVNADARTSALSDRIGRGRPEDGAGRRRRRSGGDDHSHDGGAVPGLRARDPLEQLAGRRIDVEPSPADQRTGGVWEQRVPIGCQRCHKFRAAGRQHPVALKITRQSREGIALIRRRAAVWSSARVSTPRIRALSSQATGS